jgi:Quinolinate phosphoribosyl transferase, C-terminal domain/Glutathione S-transferase, C-terminal domain
MHRLHLPAVGIGARDEGVGADQAIDLCPLVLRPEIDTLNSRITKRLLRGVYAVGQAKDQMENDAAMNELFGFLDEMEALVVDGRTFLLGDQPTLADVLIFTPLLRFDGVYNPLFRQPKTACRLSWPRPADQSHIRLVGRCRLSVCWLSSRIAIVRSNMCSGRALSFIRPTACPCGKWRGARASADPRSGVGKRDTDLKRGVPMIGARAISEASGRVTPETARMIAETGVDLISVGSLTHSAPILDIGLDAA